MVDAARMVSGEVDVEVARGEWRSNAAGSSHTAAKLRPRTSPGAICSSCHVGVARAVRRPAHHQPVTNSDGPGERDEAAYARRAEYTNIVTSRGGAQCVRARGRGGRGWEWVRVTRHVRASALPPRIEHAADAHGLEEAAARGSLELWRREMCIVDRAAHHRASPRGRSVEQRLAATPRAPARASAIPVNPLLRELDRVAR